jgi:hypothetical protein
MSGPPPAGERRYRVALRRPRALTPTRQGPVRIFHGVNKSGSLAMARVLAEAYADAGRAAEFHSHYRGDAASGEAFLQLIEGAKGAAFFVGHNLYGASSLPRAQYRLLTQLRHPLPRVVSCYHWLKRRHLREGGEEASFPSLDQWVVATRGRSYSQLAQFAVPFVPARQELLAALSPEQLQQQARVNIARDVDCIGIAEYFEESIFLFAAVCGLDRVPAWRRDNRNKDRVMTWDLPQGTRELIEEVYRQDFLLYDWALERFFAQLRRVGLAGDIDAYRQACAEQYKDRLLMRDIRRETGLLARWRDLWRGSAPGEDPDKAS